MLLSFSYKLYKESETETNEGSRIRKISNTVIHRNFNPLRPGGNKGCT